MGRKLNFANSDMAKCFRSVCKIWYRHDILHNIRFSVRYEECPDVGPDAQRLVQAGLLQDKASHLVISNLKCCGSAFRFNADPDSVSTSHFDADANPHRWKSSSTGFSLPLSGFSLIYGSGSATGPMYFVFCRLYPFSLQPPRQYLGPSRPLSTLNCITGAPSLVIWLERIHGTR